MHGKGKTKSNSYTMVLCCHALLWCGYIGFYVACWSISLINVHCLVSLEQQLQLPGSLCLSFNTSTALLSIHLLSVERTETWSLAGWLCSFQSTGFKQSHLSRSVSLQGMSGWGIHEAISIKKGDTEKSRGTWKGLYFSVSYSFPIDLSDSHLLMTNVFPNAYHFFISECHQLI